MYRLLFLLPFTLLMFGCATNRPIYYWGNFSTLTYGTFTKPDEVEVDKQIALLELDIEKAKSKNLSVPPGTYAQIGYLYLDLGDIDQSIGAFETEMALFPESEVFMKRVLNSLHSAE